MLEKTRKSSLLSRSGSGVRPLKLCTRQHSNNFNLNCFSVTLSWIKVQSSVLPSRLLVLPLSTLKYFSFTRSLSICIEHTVRDINILSERRENKRIYFPWPGHTASCPLCPGPANCGQLHNFNHCWLKL